MVSVFFACTTSQGEYQKCSFGGNDLESCLKTLDRLVASGWQLHEAYLNERSGKLMKLPVEAFNGELVDTQLAKLQRTWETILKHPNYFLRAFEHNKEARKVIDRALESQNRLSQQREETKRRTEHLFKKMDTIQARIQETKAEWGVV